MCFTEGVGVFTHSEDAAYPYSSLCLQKNVAGTSDIDCEMVQVALNSS